MRHRRKGSIFVRPSAPVVSTFGTVGSPTLNGDGTCTIDSTGGDRIQAPASLLDETQGWVATCVKPTWASGGALPEATCQIFKWGDGNFDHEVVCRFEDANTVGLLRGILNADETEAAQDGTFASGDPVVIVAKWTATTLYVSVQGAAFASTANASIPVIAATIFDIGSVNGVRQIDSPMAWFACGTGVLTNADATTLNALGATNITFSTLPVAAAMTMRWTCDDFTYERPAVQSGPTVTITSPAPSATVAGMILLRGTNSSAVTKVEVSVDGGPYKTASRRLGKWRISWNTGTLSAASHTFTVRATDASNNIATASVTVTVSASTIISGIQLFKLGDAGYTNTSNKSSVSLFVVGQPTDGTSAGTAALAASGQPTRHLLWSQAVNTGQAAGDGMGPSGAEITAGGWWLHELDGTTIKAYGDGSSYMTNIGSVGYQDAVIAKFLNVIFPRFPLADGVLFDNIFDYHWNGPTFEYANNAVYRTAMLSFVQRVGTAIQDAGYYMAGNVLINDGSLNPPGNDVNDGTQWVWWMQQLAPYMDGMAQEYYLRFSGGSPVRTIGTANINQFWTTFQSFTAACEAIGVDHLAWAGGSMSETALMTYCKASFLLDWDNRGGSTFSYSSPFTAYSSATDVWNAAYTLDVGAPSGAKTQPQPGLYRRQFANALVLVNANGSGGSLTQDGHTLAPGTAFIG